MFYFLRKDPSFDKEKLFNYSGFKKILPTILLRFFISGLALAALAYYLDPSKFLEFVKEKPGVWIVVMFAYPLLSAYPHEIIYRAYFFHRFRELFPSDLSLILASSLLFGLAHIILGNWFAVVLSALGGILFSISYLKSKSLLAASFEHALYGDLIFTLGLGRYFYHGYAA